MPRDTDFQPETSGQAETGSISLSAPFPVAGSDASSREASPVEVGGQLDVDEGPEPGADTEPSIAALRAEILEKVAVYARRRWTPKAYVPGKTPAPYAGRVFDETEVVTLGDASRDFWITSGRF